MKDVRIKVMQTGSNSSFKVVYEEEGGRGRGYMYMGACGVEDWCTVILCTHPSLTSSSPCQRKGGYQASAQTMPSASVHQDLLQVQ